MRIAPPIRSSDPTHRNRLAALADVTKAAALVWLTGPNARHVALTRATAGATTVMLSASPSSPIAPTPALSATSVASARLAAVLRFRHGSLQDERDTHRCGTPAIAYDSHWQLLAVCTPAFAAPTASLGAAGDGHRPRDRNRVGGAAG